MMEGIILDPAVYGSLASAIGVLILLGIVVAIVLFGYMADEERGGRRLFWAEWPLPGAGEPTAAGEESRKPETRKVA